MDAFIPLEPWRGEASDSGTASDRALRSRYRHYRRQQARALLTLMPREALRPLYRRASEGLDRSEPVSDPLAVVADYVESRFPLPPFEVWCEDLRRHPGAHFEESWMDDSVPGPGAPLLMDAREEHLLGSQWRVTLKVFRDDVWRGFLSFEDVDRPRAYRTTDVFRELDLPSLRGRFHELDAGTLEAFLRSVLP